MNSIFLLNIFFIGNQINFIKKPEAPLSIQVYKRTQKQKRKKKTRKKIPHKDPTTAEIPKHPSKNPKTLSNITSQQEPSCFCPE